jgi:hypothetical protein
MSITDDEDERAFVQLLARQEEPTPVATPQQLAQQVRLQLPDAPPAVVARRERYGLLARRTSRALIFGLIGLLMVLGAWSVLVDSTLPTRLLAGTGLDRVLLVLTLLVKPLLGALMTQGPLLLAGLGLLAAGAALWWYVLRQMPAYGWVRVRR